MEFPRLPDPAGWTAFKSHISHWFYKPDFEAVEAVFSAVYAHNVVEGDPVWLFVQGPSGSGKGEICIQSLRDLLPVHTEVLSTVNRHTFISFNRGELGGILPTLPEVKGVKSGIFAFKDLTTLLSLRDDDRNEVIAQLREIYDGSWGRGTGAGRHEWMGKVTCIAACTPILENAWALKRDLGERFLTVRWPRSDNPTALAKAAGKQRGHEKIIRKTTSNLAKNFLNSAKPRPLALLPEDIFCKVGALSEMVACLRASVHRSSGGKREITGSPVPEEPGRIHKSLAALASAHAALWNRDDVTEDDFRIARRVGVDSIPMRRLEIFRHIPVDGSWITASVLAKTSGVSVSTVVWNADELVSVGALEANEAKEVREYRMSPKFVALVSESGVRFHAPSGDAPVTPVAPTTDSGTTGEKKTQVSIDDILG